MAVSALVQFDVRTTGSDTNSGGFVAGAAGADFSQQDSANATQQGTGTTLSGNGGSITSGATTCNVAAATNLYGARQALLANPLVGDWIKIDSEIMKVTAVSGNTLTITRAQLTTSAASHNDGATVTNISNVSTTDLATAGTTTITSAAGYYSANVIGNLIYVTGGTAPITASWYQITNVGTSGANTTLTVDRSTGLTTGTGATGNIGGALASPGGLGLVLTTSNVGVAGQTANIKSGTYTETSTSNASGGRLNTTNAYTFSGYTTTHGDGAPTRPIITTSTGSYTLWTVAGTGSLVENIDFNGNSQTAIIGLSLTGIAAQAYNCIFRNCTTQGATTSGAGSRFFACEVSACGTGLNTTANGVGMLGCYVTACTTNGINLQNTSTFLWRCIIAGTTSGANVIGSAQSTIVQCTSDGAAGGTSSHGFSTANSILIACLATNNAGYGFGGGTNSNTYVNCFTYLNSQGTINSGSILLNIGATAVNDPYVNLAGGNYGLNNTAGAGASVRAAGWPSTWVGLSSTTSYSDGGAVQHADPSNVTFSPVGLGGFIQGVPQRS